MLNTGLSSTVLSSANHRPPPSGEHPSVLHDELPEFVCVSAILRRLLRQAEITGPRLGLACLEGETGSGKHHFAQILHQRSAVSGSRFLRRDAREWLATEAEAAELTGTLYLDRADLLAPTGQGLLLNLVKALENNESSAARLLLLVSTPVSLRQLASQGQFLPDLAFRLTAVRFSLPPLRDHREDIAPLTQALVDRICRRYQQPTTVLAQGTLPRLLQHTWPGNVRELASVLESAILESPGGVLRPANLALGSYSEAREAAAGAAAAPLLSSLAPLPNDLALDAVIHRHIQLVLEINRGNKLRAARQLGISRSTLYRILGGEAFSGR
jgi:two-component system response regulator AtoC